MSTLNRALSKIYGQDASKALEGEQDAPEESCQNASRDATVPAAQRGFPGEKENEACEDFEGDEQDFIDYANADVDGQSVTNSSELTGAILRVDGVSSAMAAPHFDLANFRPDESKDEPFEVFRSDPEPQDQTAEILDDGPIDEAGVVQQSQGDDRLPAADAARQEPTIERQRKPVVALHPEWEVDRFRWPETCQRLILEKDEVLQAAVESLCQMNTGGGTIVGLVGEQPGDGVSTMALCIARCAAQAGRRVIVVDADISTPSLATILGLNTPCSWHDSIIGDAPLAESIVLSVEDQLSMMPLHLDCQQSKLTLTDKRVTALLREASASNDLIVVDCGAIERLAERADMLDGKLPCDLAVVVRDVSRERSSDADDVIRTLRQLHVETVMLAENFVHLPKPSGDGRKNSAA